MKTREIIYLGLAALLTLSSLSAPMIVLAAGTDTSLSSSQSSSISSTQFSSGLSSNADSSSTSQDTETTINATDKGGKSQTVKAISDKAEVQVQPIVGYLSLDEVPNFDFGNITTTDIYNGTNDKLTSKDSQLVITDTTGGKYWVLTATMSRFTSDQGNQLKNNVIIYDTNLEDNMSIVLVDDNEQPEDGITYTKGSYSSKVSGTLRMSANYKLKLMNNEKYSSTITWNLSSQTPAAAPLK